MEHHQFPHTRKGLTRKFKCGLEVYLTMNPQPNGDPGEVFVKLGKQGSTVSGLVQAWAVTISAALQRGVAWKDLREKYRESTFEPRTEKYSSLVDAIAQNIDEMIEDLRSRNGQAMLHFDEGAE